MRCEPVSRRKGGGLVSPSAERNKEPIAAVLKAVLPGSGCVLEVSSGTGQHVVYFAAAMPHLTWQPSEAADETLTSISRWLEDAARDNVRPPVRLDVTERPWPVKTADAVVCLNMIHIAPWRAAEALIGGAGGILAPGAPLVLYGPFRRGGIHTAESNAAFDQQLQKQNPEWGVRDLEDVAAFAAKCGFGPAEVVAMPANNLTVIFRREEALR